MVFQSEREPGNPFFQIYLMDMVTGRTRRVSPGTGKTTCAWIHPSGDRVMFSSTHEDPRAVELQQQELDRRVAGKQRRYSWDYDEQFEIYSWHRDGGELTRLTGARGYDAEGCYSPDGRRIVFASNRHAYTDPPTAADAAKFEVDKSFLMDLYIMNADGSDVQRLTSARGYDGGPFFSPNGQRICWRRFDEEGTVAEVFTMNTDGSDQKQITNLGAMSWAPFYHPSGDYLVFTTNVHGFANFELYLVDTDGRRDPIRVTHTDGFDGLPVFTPDGRNLVWTAKRAADGSSQLFMAEWNDGAARDLLGLKADPQSDIRVAPAIDTRPAPTTDTPAITEHDLKAHIVRLAGQAMEGRLTGTRGEKLATRYVADLFERYGLEPAGNDGTFFQPFEYTAGAELGPNNMMQRHADDGDAVSMAPDRDWRPLAFSSVGSFGPAPVVFAGYGITAPPDEQQKWDEYDSYAHLDVTDKWVMVLRYMPEDLPAPRRQQLARYAGLRYKAMVARDRGAVGLIVVSGPNAAVRQQLVPLTFDASAAGTSIAAVSVTDKAAAKWLATSGKKLRRIQTALDGGKSLMGFAIRGVRASATIDIRHEKRTGRNVLARLRGGVASGKGVVLVGAHVDHLGRGVGSSSLASKADSSSVHYGADDNASGVAALLEMAQRLAARARQGDLTLQRDIVFAAWSGEELGLLGSSHFARRYLDSELDSEVQSKLNSKLDSDTEPGAAAEGDSATLYPAIIANINLDMIGRYRDGLTLHGVGSSTAWPALIEQANAPVGLRIKPQNDSYVPTDATTFFVKGVPVLSAFTGAHADYHTPRDTPDKINYPSTERITRFVARIVQALATAQKVPDYVAAARPQSGTSRGGLRAYLGTIPDYSQSDVKGLTLSGVAPGGPADQAGVKGADVVVELAGRRVENIYDYTYAIEALKIGDPAQIVVLRNGRRVELRIVPESRE